MAKQDDATFGDGLKVGITICVGIFILGFMWVNKDVLPHPMPEEDTQLDRIERMVRNHDEYILYKIEHIERMQAEMRRDNEIQAQKVVD